MLVDGAVGLGVGEHDAGAADDGEIGVDLRAAHPQEQAGVVDTEQPVDPADPRAPAASAASVVP